MFFKLSHKVEMEKLILQSQHYPDNKTRLGHDKKFFSNEN